MRILTAAALGVSCWLLGLTPAAAASDTVNVPDVIFSDSCNDLDYTYSIGSAAGYADVTVTATVSDRYGREVGRDVEFGAYGHGTLFVCGDRPGAYYIETEVNACDANYNCQTLFGPSTNVELRKPRTKVSLSASTTRNVVTFRVTRREEFEPHSYAPDSGYVALQVKIDGRWKPIPGSRHFAYQGHVAMRYISPHRAVQVRAITSDSAAYVPSTSRPVTIR